MAASYCLAVFLLLLPELAVCLTGRIPLGSKLSAGANQTWVSENRTFAVGFTSSALGDGLELAIWYAELPGERTIVWSANRNSPVGRDAVMELDPTGNLILVDRTTPIWTSNTTGHGVKTAAISDSGCLVLFTADDQVAWQSFWHPSDTLLPGQSLNVSLELTSPRSSLGYYSLKMLQQSTSLVLALTYISRESDPALPESDPALPESYANYSYWSGPQISNVTGDIVAILDKSGNFGISYGPSSAGMVYIHKNDTSGNRSFLRRIRIQQDGNLRLYRWDDSGLGGSQKWVTEWSAVSNPCEVTGVCGNGICSLDGSKTNASCSCPLGTSPAAAGPNNGGCLSNMSSPPLGNCSNNSSAGLQMVTMLQTNYYFSGPSIIANYSDVSTASKCHEYCLLDCHCVSSVYGLLDDKAHCWTLRHMVFGGFQDPSSTLFMKVRVNSSGVGVPSGFGRGGSTEPSSGESKGSRPNLVLILPLILCISVLAVLLILLLYYSIHCRRLRRLGVISKSLTVPGAPLNFSYHELQAATSNFSQMLGTGGFGSVYEGNLRDGTLIAVKKLERLLPHGEKEFIMEVTTIGSMHHMNLVRLCGFCSEGSNRLLVYEYMSNGSLDKWIFPSRSGRDRFLDWNSRFRIAVEIAQGIAYFHEQCRDRIIHCDIKPENILLDENFCPKVSDFGLAKLMGREHSHVMTMVRGTRGYLAPEWVSNRPITVKADVYSYGMLLLEIVGGRRNLDVSLHSEDFFFPGWAFKEMTNGTPAKAADQRLKGEVVEEELVRTLNAAFWCIQEEVCIRPSMGEVVKILEGSVEMKTPPMPQTVLELMEEGLNHVYRAMKRNYFAQHISSSTMITSNQSSQATCSYSSMSPR